MTTKEKHAQDDKDKLPMPYMVFECEKVKCGRANCRSCPHGPYWYLYSTRKGKLTKTYLGKELPEWAIELKEYGSLSRLYRLLRGYRMPRTQGAWRERLTEIFAELVESVADGESVDRVAVMCGGCHGSARDILQAAMLLDKLAYLGCWARLPKSTQKKLTKALS